MKLISMMDFVLKQIDVNSFDEDKIKNICNYANFLKQPLKLSMLVPCDDKGKPFVKYIELGKGLLQKHEDAKTKIYLKTTIDFETAKFHVKQKRTLEYFTNFEIEISDYAIQKFELR